MLALLLAAATSASAIDAAITKQLDEQHIAGAAVGVYQDGALVDLKTFGYRDVAKKLPVDAGTRFEIGSVTKQFTAAAILQLQEQGKLSIDDRLAKYLPSFPHANEVTLRQLLNQISGLPDYTDLPDIATAMSTTADATDKIVAYANKPLNFPPGTKWQYSNTNYWVLGKVVATVSGMSYEDYVREHVFKPAGMTHSGFVSDESTMDDFAIPYWHGPKNDGPAQPAPTMFESWPGGAGAIVSTIGDLAAWDAALASGKIVSPANYVHGRLADAECNLPQRPPRYHRPRERHHGSTERRRIGGIGNDLPGCADRCAQAGAGRGSRSPREGDALVKSVAERHGSLERTVTANAKRANAGTAENGCPAFCVVRKTDRGNL
jgi:CubicO group peptidase (beta-lactamase class C family)